MRQPAAPIPEFERLLRLFDPDRERAAQAYEAARQRLVRFFVWRECAAPEECVDLTLDRVGRRLAEGQAVWVDDPLSYVFGVARNVAREAQAGRGPLERGVEPLSEAHVARARAPHETAEQQAQERRLASLDECLAQLPPESRALVLDYYVGEQGGAKIASRQALAARLRVSLVALRLRVHRLRRQLEQCLQLKLQALK